MSRSSWKKKIILSNCARKKNKIKNWRLCGEGQHSGGSTANIKKVSLLFMIPFVPVPLYLVHITVVTNNPG